MEEVESGFWLVGVIEAWVGLVIEPQVELVLELQAVVLSGPVV